jgi:hypothetical protein
MTFGTLDTAPLTSTVEPDDLPTRTPQERNGRLGCWLALSIGIWLFLGVVALVLRLVPPQPWWALVPVGIATLATLGLLRSALDPETEYRSGQVRIDRFVAANGMTLTREMAEPASGPGAIFHHGRDRSTTDLVRAAEPRAIELGWHHYTTGNYHEPHYWSYATTPLDGPGVACLPHLLLSARGRWTDADLPRSPDQSMGTPDVHGPGADAYRVFAPIGRAATVRRVLDQTLFRPEVLERITERRVHVEIVEGRLYLYTQERMVTTDAATWHWVLNLLCELAEVLEDTARGLTA